MKVRIIHTKDDTYIPQYKGFFFWNYLYQGSIVTPNEYLTCNKALEALYDFAARKSRKTKIVLEREI